MREPIGLLHLLNHKLLVVASLLLAAPTQAAAPPAILAADLPDLVAKVLPGVVNISSSQASRRSAHGWDAYLEFWGIPQERRQASLGSGFILDSDGYLLTNSHVVQDADEVLVTFMDKRTATARIVGTDQKMDIALLQLRRENPAQRKLQTAPKPTLTSVALGNSDAVRIAEAVFAVGNPFGLQHTVTTGIISAKNRTIGLGPFDNFLQTDASINPGNSGGPLFNLKGEVIGINTVIYSRTGQSGGLGFAIPINEAKTILADLKRYGRVPRPWLGILAERVTPAMAAYYGLPVDEGIVVYNLVASGPADRAGVRQGDVLLALGGQATLEPNDLERALSKHRPKERVKLKLQRGALVREIEIQLNELPRLDRLPPGII